MRLPDFDFNFRLPRPPFVLLAVALVLTVASWIPLVLIARTRTETSPNRPIHGFLDMDVQPKFQAQQLAPVRAGEAMFLDHRAMRPIPPGTVALGELHPPEEAHLYYGYQIDGDLQPVKQPDPTNPERDLPVFFEGFPSQINVDEAFVMRGRDRYNAYCFTCHGLDGRGNGPTNVRAQQSKQPWTPPANLILRLYRERSEGYLYNVITHGYNTMAAYGSQISVEDRWAIVAYLRALQMAQPVEDEPATAG